MALRSALCRGQDPRRFVSRGGTTGRSDGRTVGPQRGGRGHAPGLPRPDAVLPRRRGGSPRDRPRFRSRRRHDRRSVDGRASGSAPQRARRAVAQFRSGRAGRDRRRGRRHRRARRARGRLSRDDPPADANSSAPSPPASGGTESSSRRRRPRSSSSTPISGSEVRIRRRSPSSASNRRRRRGAGCRISSSARTTIR